MKYCEQTTLAHPVCNSCNSVLDLISELFSAEGCRSNHFNEEKGISLDKLEISRCKGASSRQPTMDMAVGIKRKDSPPQSPRSPQMLLVELKLRVNRPANIGKSDIEKKINHSISLLTREVTINDKKILIFSDNQFQVAKSHIARLYSNSPQSKVLVYTVQQFKEEYFPS